MLHSELIVAVLQVKSHDYTPARVFDLMFIDGDHSYDGLMGDCKKLLPYLKPGGYFAIHDYFGWYSKQGRNGSPIRKVRERCLLLSDLVNR